LSRLAFSIARPPRVLILFRKPCSRFRGIFFGWYVLFGTPDVSLRYQTVAYSINHLPQKLVACAYEPAHMAVELNAVPFL
jgi:hypothetical protein